MKKQFLVTVEEVGSTVSDADDEILSIKRRVRALEIELIAKALKKTQGNRTAASRILEITHRALLYKIKEYGIEM